MSIEQKTTLAEIMDDEEFLAHVRDSLLPMVWGRAIPIVAQQDGILRQHGTGTLFRIAQRSFLVTAAHVFTDALRVSAILRVRTSGEAPRLVPIGGTLIRSRSQGEDSIDLGIMELAQSVVTELSGYQSIGLADIDQTQETSDDLYIVAGFPCELARPGTMTGESIRLSRFFASTYPYRGPTDRFANYQATHHLLLDARPEHCEIVRGSGKPLDSYEGLSGGSIWKTNATRVGREKWQPSCARIAAVQTAQYRNPGIARGTMWRHVAFAVHQSHPELRPALNLRLPQV